MSSSSFFRPRPRPTASLRLFCFPHAGGAASVFRAWPDALPPWIEVCAYQAPGRGWRMDEDPHEDLSALVDAATADVRSELADGKAWALFGHSMGAVVAYEVARRLEAEGESSPAAVFASGRRAPSLPATEPPLADLPDAEFLEEVQRRYGGIPEVVRDEPDLMAQLLPTLRTDIRALANHEHRPEPTLEAPVVALGGTGDATVSEAELAGWRDVTRGTFGMRMFEGGHFYLERSRSEVVAYLSSRLRAMAPAEVPGSV